MEGVGRARGRARSRSGPLEHEEEGQGSSEESGSTDEPAVRGRGGFRPAETLRTIPRGVNVTTGDNTGTMRILTNFFRLRVPTDQVIHSYRIDFEPNVEAIRVRRALVFRALATVFQQAYIFDGGNEIKSLQEMDETTAEATRTEGTIVNIRIRPTSSVGWGCPEMLRFYNTQMRRNLSHLNFVQVGRDYYDKEHRKPIPEHSIEIWPGISTAINEHDGGILMCTDTIHKIIRRETALDALRDILQNNRDNFREVARKELPGKIVMTRYNNKTYRIDDVIFNKNPVTCSFERRGTTITLKDYYIEQYQQRVDDDQQPLLLVQPTEKQRRGGDNKELLLIPEFCLMTGLSEMMKQDFQFKRKLADETRLDPVGKTRQLMAFMRNLKDNENVRTEMANWRLGFDDKLIEIRSKVLPLELIQTWGEDGKDIGSHYNQGTGNFEKEIRSKKMKVPIAMTNWCLIAVRRDKAVVDEFFANLRRVCNPLGIEIGPPKMFPIDNDRVQSYSEACNSIPEGARLVIIVVPNTNAQRYNAVKRYFCCERPVPTQVITTRVLNNKKSLLSVATKILIQMATKLGAVPWTLFIPPRGTMIVGYDTYHDSEKRGYSVGGFVCTTDSNAGSWFSRTTYHQNREELCANFATNFRAGLKTWMQKNKEWPKRVLIYRDGVSEGQISHVYNVELREMQKVMTEKEGLANTEFSFVIVTKRVNARFAAIDGTNLRNPPPATVIDSVITRKERYDFYLISQSVRQGTVNPTMYNIIADNTGWSLFNHQQMAYKLCHLYYNWAGTISVPAPCQYAHKLAYLTGTALHKEHHVALSNTLFFL